MTTNVLCRSCGFSYDPDTKPVRYPDDVHNFCLATWRPLFNGSSPGYFRYWDWEYNFARHTL